MQQPRDAAVSEVGPGLWSSTTRHLVSRPLRSIAAAPCRLPRGARGGRMRSVFAREFALRYRTLLPDCHFMFVYDAGRAIGAERPEALAYIALEFFERRDLFLVSRESGMAFP